MDPTIEPGRLTLFLTGLEAAPAVLMEDDLPMPLVVKTFPGEGPRGGVGDVEGAGLLAEPEAIVLLPRGFLGVDAMAGTEG